jgi:hypothetical protein
VQTVEITYKGTKNYRISFYFFIFWFKLFLAKDTIEVTVMVPGNWWVSKVRCGVTCDQRGENPETNSRRIVKKKFYVLYRFKIKTEGFTSSETLSTLDLLISY